MRLSAMLLKKSPELIIIKNLKRKKNKVYLPDIHKVVLAQFKLILNKYLKYFQDQQFKKIKNKYLINQIEEKDFVV